MTLRDEQRVVGGDVGVVAGGEAPGLGIPEIAVRRQRAAAVAVGDPGRLERRDRLLDRGSDPIGEEVEVGLDQLGARLVAELGVDVRAGVGVRHADQQRRLVQAGAGLHRRAKRALVGPVLEPADVHGDEGQRRRVAGERREHGGRGGERPVDAFGGVVGGGAPGAGVDPDRRRHVPGGDAESAAGVAVGGVHVVSLPQGRWLLEVVGCVAPCAARARRGPSREHDRGRPRRRRRRRSCRRRRTRAGCRRAR